MNWWAGDIASLVTCLLYKHEGLSLSLRTYEKELGMIMWGVCNPALGSWQCAEALGKLI